MEITPENLRKMQLLDLKVLVEIKRICDKHNIKFILIAGTLLGAVRHKGFIPWDDDIDIGMTRENFDKFCKIAPLELSKEFFLQTPSTDSKCHYEHHCLAKVRLEGTKMITKKWKFIEIDREHNGFFVDVFSYDNIPDSYWFGCFHWYVFKYIKRVLNIRRGIYRPKKIIPFLISYFCVIISLPISTKIILNILKNYHKIYKKNGKYVVQLSGVYGFRRERHLRSTVIKTIQIPFEGILMPVPEEYHLFLTEQYGDYMTPPPPDERELRHLIDIDFGDY